jgi:uncharacterized protein YndB with AHSA1/START domain
MESFRIAEIASSPSELVLRAVFPNTTPGALFDAFTRPELLAQWWVPQAELEPYQGGSYRFRWAQMNWTLFGTLLVFDPTRQLKFTWKWEHAPELPQRTVNVQFEPQGTSAVLHLTHGRYSDAARDRQDRENHRTGWLHFLNQLSLLVSFPLRVESEVQ